MGRLELARRAIGLAVGDDSGRVLAASRLTNDPDEDSEPDWLGAGSIVFFSTRSGNGDVWLMDADGGGAVNLTSDPFFDGAPRVVGGTAGSVGKISFVSDRADGNLDVYTMDVDGSNLRRITTHPADDFDTSWSPDGALLAFDTNRNGHWDIYVVEASGTRVVRLTTDVADDERPVWRP